MPVDYDRIIQISLELYPEDEKAFLANVVITSLNEEKVLSLLQNFVDIKKQIHLILTSSKPKSKFLQQFRTPIISSPFVKALKSEFRQQQRILGCPKIDEHVLLLSALKLLEAKDILLYKPVLKDILQRNIHKLRDLSTDTSFVERTKAINDIVKTLSRSSRNNVVIVGKAGVGKTTLAKSMYRYLPQYTMYQLFAGGDAFIDQVINLISIQNTNKVVFMLDEIFSFESSQIKYLIEHAQVIGTAHESAYKKFATEYPHIASKLEIIMLEEPNQEELQRIINAHKDRIQQQTGVIFENDVTEEMFQLARQYMGDKFFPAKGILLFEEAANAAQYGGRKITKDIIRALISQITNIPISSLTELNKKDLSHLGDKLRKKVKGQDQAIDAVARTIQRSRLGFGKQNRPIGSFLFVGPSGVGKTELAKAIAQEVFGDAESMVRLDMSEFSEAHMVQRLIGAPPGYIGYEEGGQLTNPVKAKPYTLVLLDEIEKSHPRVFDIFLQVLDDGRLTDGQGNKVDFRNAVIIATSNAGIEDILDMIDEGKTQPEIITELKEILQDYFRIEFINRFDNIIIFNALKPDALVGIARIQIEKLAAGLAKRNIELIVTDTSLQNLAKEAYDPRYGARGLLRLIQEKIENSLAEMIISGELKEGERVEF